MMQTPTRPTLGKIGKGGVVPDNFTRQARRSITVNIRPGFGFIGTRHAGVSLITEAGVTA
jgi:hypothetical protein